MPNQTFAQKITNTWWFRNFPRIAGILVALLGLLVIIAWHAQWQAVIQMLPNTAPMQYNTALCFIFSGIGLFLLTTKYPKFASFFAGMVVVLTITTLLEYLLKLDFHIDQLFHKPYFQADTVYAGRMSPLATVCFIFTGLSILTLNLKKSWPHRLTVAGVFACIVLVVAFVALFGFLLGIQSAYGWGAYSRMAVNTAVAFFALGGSLLALAWQTSRVENFNFLRWLPVTGSVTLMAMVAFVSAMNMEELKNATYWRKHTFDVILKAQAFQDNLTALQLGARGYVTMGDTNALASYQNCLQLEPQQLNQLAELTKDNPSQQTHLKALSTAMDDVIFYDQFVIALYNQQGFAAVSKTDAKGEGRRVFGNAINVINLLSHEEQKLLEVRASAEAADYHNAAYLLILGSVLAAAFLVVANQMASRELRQRKRIEIEREKLIDDLRKAIADVKILSGMIPICGWCKSVRSDSGYWQSVEQYVRSNTNATFSHGVCPKCAEKFKAEIQKANTPKSDSLAQPN